jgi:hypothetical protein
MKRSALLSADHIGAVLRLLLCLVFFAGVGSTAWAGGSGGPATLEGLQDNLRWAETMYWVNLTERGSPGALYEGEHFLDEAERMLHELELSPADEAGYRERIDGLRTDLDHQERLARDTLHGVFPLVRFVSETVFAEPRATESFELIDDPVEVAVREAAHRLSHEALEAQAIVGQFDVAFFSQPQDREVEEEALYSFNRSGRFFVHARSELERLATPGELEDLAALSPSEESLDGLLAGLETHALLAVRVSKLAVAHHDYFYVAEGRLFEEASLAPPRVFRAYGIAIDRRGALWPIVGVHLGLVLIALVGQRFMQHRGLERDKSWGDAVVSVTVAFCWGRGMAWVLGPILSGFRPSAETLALQGFWWPALAGLSLVAGPTLMLGFADHRFKSLGQLIGAYERTPSSFVASGLGGTAFLAQAALIYTGAGALVLVPPLVVGAVVLAYGLSPALNTAGEPPRNTWIVLVILGLVFGAAWAHGAPGPLWVIDVLLVLVAVSTFRQHAVVAPRPVPQAPAEEVIAAVTTPEELKRVIQNPPYLPTRGAGQLQAMLESTAAGKTRWLGVWGPTGTGKTATLTNAVGRLEPSATLVLSGKGRTPRKGEQPRPYHLFLHALAGFEPENILNPRASGPGVLGDAVDSLFSSVVPLSSLLFPAPDGETLHAATRQEILFGVSSLLKSLSRSRHVWLVLDDLQWADEGSMELIEHLREQFPIGGSVPITFLLSGREQAQVSSASTPAESVLSLRPLSVQEREELLVASLGIERESTRTITGALGKDGENLHWLIEIVRQLADGDELQAGPGGLQLQLSPSQIASRVPHSYRRTISRAVPEVGVHRDVLECAACIGEDFQVSQLAAGLQMERLEVIRCLRRLEQDTSLVSDNRTRDEVYCFRSPAVLEVLQDVLEISNGGPLATDVPQIVREYHARLAQAYAAEISENPGFVYDVANHYYSAGRRHAGRATQALVSAARAASRQLQFGSARRYLEMAAECASLSSDGVDLELENLRVDARQAHVEGVRRLEVAQRLRAWVEARPDCGFSVQRLAAVAAYDAARDLRDQSWFAWCADLARRMSERFTSPLERAESLHLLGLGSPPAERRPYLEEALALLETPRTTEERSLRSRLLNSLAEFLAYGDEDDRARSAALFHQSIGLKSLPEVNDRHGLAMAHGGLGRLAFFRGEPDLATARHHFQVDLELSEQLGSADGQAKMHSLLGACDCAEEQWAAGLVHYEQSLNLAFSPADRAFALHGLVQCLAGLGQADALAQRAEALAEAVTAVVPTPAAGMSALGTMMGAQAEAKLRVLLAPWPELSAQPWSGALGLSAGAGEE